MSLWKIAWRSIQQRTLPSTLTAISMALGVALVITVLVIYGVIDASFRRNAQGYDLIVGAKGSPLDLVLNTVYYIGPPLKAIPYKVYEDLRSDRFASEVEAAIPICMGDNYKGYRIVGTTPELFTELEYLGGRKYRFAQGQNLATDQPRDAVIGATVARKSGLKVGDSFRPMHGVAAESGSEHEGFHVVGVLAPTGTPNDRALFVHIEGFLQAHAEKQADEAAADEDHAGEDHAGEKGQHEAPKGAKPADPKGAKPVKPAEPADHDHEGHGREKRVTAVLVKLDQARMDKAQELFRLINDEPYAQAVRPAEEITRLFEGLIGHIEWVLLILAVLIVIVAGIGILVSIYNSMNDRRHEIAIMRALGARRQTVMMIILLESILLSLGGGALGLLLGHALVAAMTPLIVEYTGVAIGMLHFEWAELILIPGLVVLASAVGYLPAVMAYRTDVARSLVANP
jgi:putative ABC transport system permease protein